MSERSHIECGSCGKPMNAAAASCPHCGARIDGAAPDAGGGLAGVRLSADEARALLVAEGGSPAAQAQGPGLFGLLFLPHPMTSGASRIAEIGLTVAALPVLMCAVFLMAILPRTYRNVSRAKPDELKTPAVASAFGAPFLGWIMLLSGMSATAAFGTAAAVASTLFVRAAVRGRAARGRDHGDLFDAPKKQREKPRRAPQLPPARATRKPPQPKAAPASRPVAASPAAPPPADGEGPSFLK